MARVIKGTKDLKNYQIVKGPSDARQVRCTKCHELANQVPDGKGSFVYECAYCKTKFQMTKI